ncbi:MAG TPA: carboxypeptidase regulatory-like domain-containing protein [Candidatus Angelobacter sp.]|nr:carboxypeptidase regulatory-like domain-containing protein [Candidatus Angelobacter sp.]
MKKLVSLAATLLFFGLQIITPQAMAPQIASRSQATVSGRVLDRLGKPMANALVVYRETAKGMEYRVKTDKNGEFFAPAVVSGYYKIEITAPNGTRIYSGSRSIGTYAGADPITGMMIGENKPLPTNVLHVDLSTVRSNGEMLSSDGAEEKVSEADLKAVRDENAREVRLGELQPELQIALDARDWPHAAHLLRELILIEPNRWEYYQNLGTLQNATSQYEAAVQTFEKGIQLASKGLSKNPKPEVRATIGGMLISQAEAYKRMGKMDEALACYHRAAEITAQPALAHYYACSTLMNGGQLEAAIQECDQAIAADPRMWEPYQAKANAENALGHTDAALAAFDAGIQAAQAAAAFRPQPEKAKAGMAPMLNAEAAKAKAGLGQMLNSEADTYARLHQDDKAIPLFTQAAEVATYPALPYLNLCAMQYNRKNYAAALAACDKAIASDPTMAEAYFVKGSILFGEGKLQQGRYQAPDGTREALNKYLELNPEGQNAPNVRAMLAKLDARSENTTRPKTK